VRNATKQGEAPFSPVGPNKQHRAYIGELDSYGEYVSTKHFNGFAFQTIGIKSCPCAPPAQRPMRLTRLTRGSYNRRGYLAHENDAAKRRPLKTTACPGAESLWRAVRPAAACCIES